MSYFQRAKVKMQEQPRECLYTMISVGNSMGIAFIGSIFFGIIGTASIASTAATADIGSHSNTFNHIRIHHYTNAFVISTLYTIGLVIATFALVFFLPSLIFSN